MNLAYPPGDKSWKFRGGLNWDHEQFEKAKERIKNYRTCLDLGGHIGITSIRFSKYFEQVHAFEPINFEYFKQNTSGIENITLYEHAVSDHEGTVDMFINTNNSGGCTVIHEGVIDYLYRKNLIVDSTPYPCKPVDSYNFKDVDFVKIDVEGYNIPVINGMKELLKDNDPVMHIEMANDPKYNQKFAKLMKSLDYRVFANIGHDKFYERA